MRINKVRGLKGEITVASDKSISHRAVMLGAIARGKTRIEHFLMAEDCLSTVNCFHRMGIDIVLKGTSARVFGRGVNGLCEPKEALFTGNSGTTTRLLCGLLAAQPFSCTLMGDESLSRRPMERVIRPLEQMGARIKAEKGGRLPLHIDGRALKGITYSMPVASAQLKSALILAGLYAEGETRITEPIPSRNHTELMINGFGGNVKNLGGQIVVQPAKELYSQVVHVPGDISSAAFFMVAGLIVPNSEIRIKNVGLNPTRTGIIEVLKAMGANISIEQMEEKLEPIGDVVVKSSKLHGMEVGGALIPRLIDEIPILAVAASFAEGETVIRDGAELKVKESNRIEVMTRELLKAGVDIIPCDDGFRIQGGNKPHSASFDSYGDHRIAMAMTIFALACDEESTVADTACINISYPQFFQTLKEISF